MKIPASDCVNRWNTLRNRFSKERNKIAPSGSSSGKSKEWELLKYMQFLHTHMRKRKTFGNLPEENEVTKRVVQELSEENCSGINTICYEAIASDLECTQDNEIFGDVSCENIVEQSTPKNKNPKNPDMMPIINEAVNVLKSLSSSGKQGSKELSVENFCDSLHHDLMKMDAKKLRQCKQGILRLIDEYSDN
ncbi:uncharacterized protein LOC123314579 [Coccinella septempunctata]|uniref:uncharacterized protein LOC123314579 n=1 Tax=Coccinella septempunctata TaxID=41139 RepID=UPI001D08F608|nr:uncharacterized protein LOC123314579 [Coccinella septempunctata]